MKTHNVGLIGFGLGGQIFHAPFIHLADHLHLATIKTSSPENIKLAEKRYPEVTIAENNEDVIKDESLDVIVISVPNHLHFDLCRSALLAGKHVVVDKPFTISSTESETLIKLAEKVKKHIFVFQNRRLDSDFLTVKKLINSKRLGKIVETEIHFDRYRPIPKESWKEQNTPGVGTHWDLGPHLIDQAVQLFGIPIKIWADLKSQRPKGEIIDYFDIQLFYDGFKVILKAGSLVQGPVPRYKIHGEEATFIKYSMDIQEPTMVAGTFPKKNEPWVREPEEQYGMLYTPEGSETIPSETGHYIHFYNNVADTLNGVTSPLVMPQEAHHIIQLIELAIESNETGKVMPVDLK